jgi:hypothetical protein
MTANVQGLVYSKMSPVVEDRLATEPLEHCWRPFQPLGRQFQQNFATKT